MLNGKRVTVRAFIPSDVERFWAFRNDLEVELLRGSLVPHPRSFETYRAGREAEQSVDPR